MAGKTMIHDKSTGKTYVGSFTPTATSTAHQQLASAAGVSTRNAVGGGLRLAVPHLGLAHALQLP